MNNNYTGHAGTRILLAIDYVFLEMVMARVRTVALERHYSIPRSNSSPPRRERLSKYRRDFLINKKSKRTRVHGRNPSESDRPSNVSYFHISEQLPYTTPRCHFSDKARLKRSRMYKRRKTYYTLRDCQPHIISKLISVLVRITCRLWGQWCSPSTPP